ncbi:hypothetical protein [Nitrosococcus watsonii]|uniref:DUF4393 domain-containing protein n=1 Tax=Nitrosococcus watsoni (strain C-113) TaxID=105559 RepID=D8K4Z1_NITWC|nr:hypothetical protein [Nitrosococcus watsonii]ADJ27968.1 hypothetical protein Nwat_1026 [Nitrosococcus watsonii C-113]
MSEDKDELVKASTGTETALDVASFVGSAVPWIGGPVSNVLGGMSLGRKLGRVREVLESLSNDLKEFKSEASESYVKTEEFEDLLEQTLKRVGEERNEEKRHLYKAFLTDAIESPEPYDDQLCLLRTFEQISPDHIRVLKAFSQEPNPNPGMMGSPIQTLRERLPELDEQHIEEIVAQLNDMRVTNLGNLKVMMTGHGAADIRIDFFHQLLKLKEIVCYEVA